MKVYIHRNGQNYGPFSTDSLRQHIKRGMLTNNDWAITDKTKEWVPLSDLLERKLEKKESQNPVSTELSDAEVSEYFEKILKLVSSNKENLALDIARSLNNPKLYEKLLRGSSIKRGIPILSTWSVCQIIQKRELENEPWYEFFKHPLEYGLGLYDKSYYLLQKTIHYPIPY